MMCPSSMGKTGIRDICIDSRTPDHQVLEAGYLFRRLLHLDFAVLRLQSGESAGCGKNQFGSGNTPRSSSEIWQGIATQKRTTT